MLAVAGRAVSVEDLRRRWPEGDASLDAAVEAALDADLLRLDEAAIDFRHALLRDAYYADLPMLTRTRLHSAIAKDLDQNGRPELAGEAARHLLAGGDRRGAAQLLVRAANHALSLGALNSAEELLTEASQLEPDDVDILLDWASVAAHRGMTVEAQTRFDRVIDVLGASDDPMRVATAHIRRAEWNTGPLCRPEEALRSVGQALEVLDGAGVSAIRLRIEAQAFMALCEAMAGDTARCDDLLDRLDTQCGRLPADPDAPGT